MYDFARFLLEANSADVGWGMCLRAHETLLGGHGKKRSRHEPVRGGGILAHGTCIVCVVTNSKPVYFSELVHVCALGPNVSVSFLAERNGLVSSKTVAETSAPETIARGLSPQTSGLTYIASSAFASAPTIMHYDSTIPRSRVPLLFQLRGGVRGLLLLLLPL